MFRRRMSFDLCIQMLQAASWNANWIIGGVGGVEVIYIFTTFSGIKETIL